MKNIVRDISYFIYIYICICIYTIEMKSKIDTTLDKYKYIYIYTKRYKRSTRKGRSKKSRKTKCDDGRALLLLYHTLRWSVKEKKIILTALVSEDGLAHRARPHSEACAKLTGLRMAGQVFPKTTLVDVVFSAHWTRVVGGPSLR